MQKKGIKVQFAVVDDLKQVISQSTNMMAELDSKYAAMEKADAAFKTVGAAADKAAADATKSTAAATKLQIKIGTTLDKADKAAKDLGVPPTSVTGYVEADKLYSDLEAKMKKVNSFNFPIAEQIAKGL